MRININISKKLLTEIDKIASEIGITRTSFCVILIYQGILKMQHDTEIIQNLINDIDEIKKEIYR